jgi:hypothetical protein
MVATGLVTRRLTAVLDAALCSCTCRCAAVGVHTMSQRDTLAWLWAQGWLPAFVLPGGLWLIAHGARHNRVMTGLMKTL